MARLSRYVFRSAHTPRDVVEGPARETLFAELVERVTLALRGPCGVSDGTPLVLAVSGGADSVALAELVFRAGVWPIRTVAFVDHGLRDVADEREAARRAAQRVGAPFRELRLALREGGNLQARARLDRYRALLSLVSDDACLATGHTRTDQAETVLMRLIRGSGVQGLGGLFPRHGPIVRPLIDVGRDETQALQLDCADDPSNAGDRFMRNRVRRHILPLLARENPRIEAALSALARAARGTNELMDRLNASNELLGGLDATGLGPEAAEAYAHHLAHRAGATASRTALETWAKSLASGASSAVSLGDGFIGRSKSGRGRVESADDPRRNVVLGAPGNYSCAGMLVTLRHSAEPTHSGANTLVAASDAVSEPLVLRPMPGNLARERALWGAMGRVDRGDGAVVSLDDATGRTLGLATPDGRWMERSPGNAGGLTPTHWIHVDLQSSSAPLQSTVVALGTGPLPSADARVLHHAMTGLLHDESGPTDNAGTGREPALPGREPLTNASANQPLPNPGCAPNRDG